jgi:N6-adenosine-specific RNA methylase IME4
MRTKHNVILIDPPWQYRNFRADKGKAHGAVAAQYKTMKPREIIALPIGSFAAKDAVLFLWTTVTHIPVAISAMEAWGFKYITCIPWVKTVPNTGNIRSIMGFWTRGAAELLFIGERGRARNIKKPGFTRKDTPVGLLVGEPRVFWARAPRAGEHSKKPLEYHQWIERMLLPPYLEVFARRPRRGWRVLGDEVGSHL